MDSEGFGPLFVAAVSSIHSGAFLPLTTCRRRCERNIFKPVLSGNPGRRHKRYTRLSPPKCERPDLTPCGNFTRARIVPHRAPHPGRTDDGEKRDNGGPLERTDPWDLIR